MFNEILLDLHDDLYNCFTVFPPSVLIIPAYLSRWIPYMGTELSWIVLAFYLYERLYPNDQKRMFECKSEFVHMSGLSEIVVRKYLKNPKLRWFVEKKDQNQRCKITPNNIRFLTNRCYIRGDMPLTPTDRKALTSWLRNAGVHNDPVKVLNQAIRIAESDPYLILPPSQPTKRELDTSPDYLATSDIIMSMCDNKERSITTEQSRLLRSLAEELDKKLTTINKYKILLTPYFIENWIPRLGATTAWLVTLLRFRCYFNSFANLESIQEPEVQISEDEIAQLLGINTKEISSILSPLINVGCKNGNVIKKYFEIIEYPNIDNEFRWKFKDKNTDILLTTEHQKIYDSVKYYINNNDPSEIVVYAYILQSILYRIKERKSRLKFDASDKFRKYNICELEHLIFKYLTIEQIKSLYSYLISRSCGSYRQWQMN